LEQVFDISALVPEFEYSSWICSDNWQSRFFILRTTSSIYLLVGQAHSGNTNWERYCHQSWPEMSICGVFIQNYRPLNERIFTTWCIKYVAIPSATTESTDVLTCWTRIRANCFQFWSWFHLLALGDYRWVLGNGASLEYES
jgi:hypothetical protein